MSDTSSMGFIPASSILSRLIGSFDRLLMVCARASQRNADLPYFGL